MPAHYYEIPKHHAKALCDTCHEACQKEEWSKFELMDPENLEGTEATHCDLCGCEVEA